MSAADKRARDEATEEEGRKAFKLVGHSNFKRSNPKSDRFESLGWDHLEFWSSDATSTARRFCPAIGMQLAARSDVVTGNERYSSYAMAVNDIMFVFTSPMGSRGKDQKNVVTFDEYDSEVAAGFVRKHGFGVRAIGIKVSDAKFAYEQCIENGGSGVLTPRALKAADGGMVIISEVVYYEDVVFRFVQRTGVAKEFTGSFLPGYVEEAKRAPINYGIVCVDHVVSNMPSLADVVPRVMRMTGMHEFAEFVADDVGTNESGLNSIVLGNNDENVLLPCNEPVPGKRVSQIQTYLNYFEGPGVQHIALKTHDIFATLEAMKEAGQFAGFEFVPKPSKAYYENLPNRLGDKLTPEQYAKCEQYGVLADIDPEGELLQIFTRPVFDRPTLFFEIIQRLGCALPAPKLQKPGCGGFGKGNFTELFKSIEDFEKECERVRDAAMSSATLAVEKLDA